MVVNFFSEVDDQVDHAAVSVIKCVTLYVFVKLKLISSLSLIQIKRKPQIT